MKVYEEVNTSTLKAFRDQKVELACVVTAVSRQLSKKNGAEWARITVEDFFGTASVLAFSDPWEANQDVLVQDAAVLIRGTVSGRDRDEEAPPIFLDSVAPLNALWSNGQIALGDCTERERRSRGLGGRDSARAPGRGAGIRALDASVREHGKRRSSPR